MTTATCLAAALATIIMGLYGRYPIAQAPGMGENFFFVLSVHSGRRGVDRRAGPGRADAAGATTAWQIALGVVFYLRRALPALSVRRPRGPAGRHQPQHAQRHRRRHRPVHRVHRPEEHRPGAGRPGNLREAESALRFARPGRVLLRPVGDGRDCTPGASAGRSLGHCRRHALAVRCGSVCPTAAPAIAGGRW